MYFRTRVKLKRVFLLSVARHLKIHTHTPRSSCIECVCVNECLLLILNVSLCTFINYICCHAFQLPNTHTHTHTHTHAEKRRKPREPEPDLETIRNVLGNKDELAQVNITQLLERGKVRGVACHMTSSDIMQLSCDLCIEISLCIMTL